MKIPAGGTVRIPIQVPPLPPNSNIGKVQYELSEPPEGITPGETTQGPNATEIILQCDAAKAKLGLKGNLIVNISAERTPPAGRGALPAIPFEIVKH